MSRQLEYWLQEAVLTATIVKGIERGGGETTTDETDNLFSFLSI